MDTQGIHEKAACLGYQFLCFTLFISNSLFFSHQIHKSKTAPPTKQHPSLVLVPLYSRKCSNCGNTKESQDVEILTTILRMGFAFVGKSTDRKDIQEAIGTIPTVSPTNTVEPSTTATEATDNKY